MCVCVLYYMTCTVYKMYHNCTFEEKDMGREQFRNFSLEMGMINLYILLHSIAYYHTKLHCKGRVHFIHDILDMTYIVHVYHTHVVHFIHDILHDIHMVHVQHVHTCVPLNVESKI